MIYVDDISATTSPEAAYGMVRYNADLNGELRIEIVLEIFTLAKILYLQALSATAAASSRRSECDRLESRVTIRIDVFDLALGILLIVCGRQPLYFSP